MTSNAWRSSLCWRCLRRQLIRRVHEKDVTRAEVDHVLVFPPEERPVLFVLRIVGLEDQYAGHDPAGDEREVSATAAVCDALRVRADGRDERDVRVRMRAVQIVQSAQRMVGRK